METMEIMAISVFWIVYGMALVMFLRKFKTDSDQTPEQVNQIETTKTQYRRFCDCHAALYIRKLK